MKTLQLAVLYLEIFQLHAVKVMEENVQSLGQSLGWDGDVDSSNIVDEMD
jgi:hypothetical protein